MGDVDRLPSGRWQARTRIDGRQRKRSFARKADAVAWLAEVAHEGARGRYVDHKAGRVPLATYAAEWAAARPWRPSTARKADSAIRCHIASQPIGRLPLSAIRPSDVQAWVSGRSAVLAPYTVRQLVKLLRSVLLAAVEDRLIVETPARRIVLPSHEVGRVVPVTVAQVQAIAEQVGGRYRAMVVTQAGLGLRIGELLALRTGDVDFLRRSVRVEEQIRQHDRARVEPKTARSKRTVPLPQVVAEALSAHIAAHRPGEDGLIFCTGEGRPLWQSHYTSRVLGPAARAAGVPVSGSHFLRHHYVSVLLDAGASVPQVAELIGDTTATVMKTYAHMLPGLEERARSMVDVAWSAPPVPAADASSL